MEQDLLAATGFEFARLASSSAGEGEREEEAQELLKLGCRRVGGALLLDCLESGQVKNLFIYTYMYILFIYIYMYTYIFVYTYMYICIYIHICSGALLLDCLESGPVNILYKHIYIYTYIHVCVCVYLYIYIHICVYINGHTYMNGMYSYVRIYIYDHRGAVLVAPHLLDAPERPEAGIQTYFGFTRYKPIPGSEFTLRSVSL